MAQGVSVSSLGLLCMPFGIWKGENAMKFTPQRVAAVILSAVILAGFTGCSSGKHEQSSKQPDVKPPKPKTELVEKIPNLETEIEDDVFINQLEEVDSDLLLPLAYTLPETVPMNAPSYLTLGKSYKCLPSNQWTFKVSDENVRAYHSNGISVQFNMAKTKSTYEASNIKSELKSFYDSFLDKSDRETREVFIGSALRGHETTFSIKHNEKNMIIKAGAVSKSNEVLFWAINYYSDSENVDSTKEEIVKVLFSGLYSGSERLVLK